ncbi:MAG: nucleoside triphosphate pyrophosphohydrolase [Nitrospinae bacterium]|nr:nucleoside triphosphate pyrophosphohydrolase [Nitrospinota bacterium]
MDKKLGGLSDLIDRLRGEKGCPWDKEQTTKSLKPFLIEETHEVAEAIDSGDPVLLKEELGDLLFQIVFLSRIAKERGEFTLDDVVKTITEKMVRRHPHVFGDVPAKDAADALGQWEKIKAGEKKRNSILGGIPKSLPTLIRARRLQERAARVGFDWPRTEDVWKKVDEEWGELQEARRNNDPKGVEEEMGDVMIALVNLGRFLDVDADDALRKSIDKFIYRFGEIEKEFAETGKDITHATLDEMEAIWQKAKLKEKQKAPEV